MSLVIPSVLETLSAAGSAVRAITAWRNSSMGDSRALIGEIKDILLYLDMVGVDGVPLNDVVCKLSIAEYRRLSNNGYNFNNLKRAKIAKYSSLEGTELAKWAGKETRELIASIYDKVNEIIIKYPHVKRKKNYRWGVRVNNIRKRIWLLLKHINS